MKTPKAHVSTKKKKELVILKKMIKEYPVVGVIDITSLPSSQFQSMKHELREKLNIRVTKKRLLNILFKDSAEEKKGMDKLVPYLDKGIPAVMFSKDDPFKVFNNFKKSQSDSPAKAGQTAPNDLYAKAGPTPFTPGPIISELGALGIKTKVEAGKISITEDHLLVKEGDVIDDKTADFMSKLGLKPMKIGINLVACYDDGTVFDKDVLDVDPKEYVDNLKLAYSQAFNLAAKIGYLTPDNITILLTKNYREAISLAKAAGVTTSETLQAQFKDAAKEVLALEGKLPDLPEGESEKEEKKEEPKPEPSEEEAPKEEPPKEEKEEVVKEEEPKKETACKE